MWTKFQYYCYLFISFVIANLAGLHVHSVHKVLFKNLNVCFYSDSVSLCVCVCVCVCVWCMSIAPCGIHAMIE